MTPDPLDALYKKYRFEPVPTRQEGVRAYALPSGYFLNADVVPLYPGADTAGAKAALEASGYACTVRNYKSIEDAEEHLFSGFFAADSSRQRLRQEYSRFVRQVSETLGADGLYSYVSGPYSTDHPTGSGDVVSHLLSLLKLEGAALIILEAAAGFGKTCTSYEVMNRLLDERRDQIPILTEFSLNRRADIFRYVLLDEIDRNFPSLSSDLVQEQVQRGRTPLILDGFDELLSGGGALDDRFEDAEPMLETIGQLLEADAKVLLTTRRTAIFSEQEFEQWLAGRPGGFEVCRVRLRRPSLEDWLGYERVEQLLAGHVPIKELSNPVLLAFLKHLDPEQFKQICCRPDEIVQHYFEALLEREIKRQNLQMRPKQQLHVFHTLAADMVRYAFTTDGREYIQLRILEAHAPELERVREQYPREERPTVEELATKLANHALLDRRGGDEQQVGFVNDFILGTLVGDVVTAGASAIEESEDIELFSDLAATAYAFQSPSQREELWTHLSAALQLLDPTQQLAADLALKRQPQRPLSSAAVEGLTFERCSLGTLRVSDTTFVDCVFREVSFEAGGLDTVTFVDCTFYQCSVSGVPAGPVWVLSCRGDDSLELVAGLSEPPDVEEESEVFGPLERKVLENFWPRGRPHARPVLAIRTLYRGHAKSDYPEVAAAIERLRKREYIDLDGDQALLDSDRVAEVGALLGHPIG